MRENLIAGEKGLNDALIACLLVVCFEALSGNYFQALTHSVSGHKIFKHWLDSQKSHSPFESYSSSSRYATVGEEIINVFNRIDLQIMNYIDPRPSSIHTEMKNEGKEMVKDMPCLFTTLNESRMYLELIQRRTSHFIASTAGTYPKPETVTNTRMTRIDTGTETGTVNVHSESEVVLAMSSTMPPALRLEYASYVNEMNRWFEAFTPSYNSQEENTRCWAAAALLKIEAQTHEVMLLSSFSQPLDSFIPTFRTVVHLAEKISNDPLFAQDDLYTFDIGIVNPLRLVAKWCREPVVRRKCIALVGIGGAQNFLF